MPSLPQDLGFGSGRWLAGTLALGPLVRGPQTSPGSSARFGAHPAPSGLVVLGAPSHRHPNVACSRLPPLQVAPLPDRGTWDSRSCTPCAAAPPSSAAGAQRLPRRALAPSPRAGAAGSGTVGWARASAGIGWTLGSSAAAHAPPRIPRRTQAPPQLLPEPQPNPPRLPSAGLRPHPKTQPNRPSAPSPPLNSAQPL